VIVGCRGTPARPTIALSHEVFPVAQNEFGHAPGCAVTRAHGTFGTSEVTGWASPANRAIVRDYRDWYRRRISAHAESAIGRIAGSTEQRAKTTAITILAAAHIGTSGALRPVPSLPISSPKDGLDVPAVMQAIVGI
jgi:hypothetical protein